MFSRVKLIVKKCAREYIRTLVLSLGPATPVGSHVMIVATTEVEILLCYIRERLLKRISSYRSMVHSAEYATNRAPEALK
jgi:hypothetical protein